MIKLITAGGKVIFKKLDAIIDAEILDEEVEHGGIRYFGYVQLDEHPFFIPLSEEGAKLVQEQLEQS